MARPNQYQAVIEPKLEEIKSLRQKGLSIPEIAAKINVKPRQLTYYRTNYPALTEVLEAPLEKAIETKKSAYFNRQKNYNSLRSFIRTQSTIEERKEYFRLILEKADAKEAKDYQLMIDDFNCHQKNKKS